MTFSKWPQGTDLVVQHKNTTGRPGLLAFLSETFKNKFSDSNVFPEDALRITNRAAVTKQSAPSSCTLILLQGRPDTIYFAVSTFLRLIPTTVS